MSDDAQPPADQPIVPPPPSQRPHHSPYTAFAFKVGLCVMLLVLVLGAFSLFTDDSSSDSFTDGSGTPGTSGNALGDVTIVQCGDKRGAEYEFGYPMADVQVTNSSGSAASYTFTISFENADGSVQHTTQSAAVADLGPGQTKVEDVLAWEDIHTTDYECRVSSAERS